MRKPFFLVARPSKIPRPEDSTGGFLQGSTVHQIRVCIIIIIIVVIIIISVFIIIIKIRITTIIILHKDNRDYNDNMGGSS